mmetsp:Transcript_5364/g.22723  ORF Transcript_5364/g.22723 Transcript_5364/m.22723 type:complete len:248 (+) Transcript_5364:166-909(+)
MAHPGCPGQRGPCLVQLGRARLALRGHPFGGPRWRRGGRPYAHRTDLRHQGQGSGCRGVDRLERHRGAGGGREVSFQRRLRVPLRDPGPNQQHSRGLRSRILPQPRGRWRQPWRILVALLPGVRRWRAAVHPAYHRGARERRHGLPRRPRPYGGACVQRLRMPVPHAGPVRRRRLPGGPLVGVGSLRAALRGLRGRLPIALSQRHAGGARRRSGLPFPAGGGGLHRALPQRRRRQRRRRTRRRIQHP